MPVLLRIILLACGLILPLNSQTTEQINISQPNTSQLVIQNRKVFSFRANLGALTPEERLNLVRSRLANMPVDDLLEPVRYSSAPEGVLVSVGSHPLFSIATGDLDADIGQTLESAAANVQSMLRDALDAEAAQRNFKTIFHGILKASAATIGLLAFLAFIGKVAKFGRRKITSITISRLPKIPLGRSSMFNIRRIHSGLGLLIHAIHYTIIAIATYLCIVYVLSCFPYTQPWAGTLGSGLVTLLLNMGKTVLHSLPGLFAVAVIAFVVRGLTRLIDTIFKAVERGETTLPGIYQDTAGPTRRVAIALLWIFAIIMAYPYIPGNESIAFKGVSIFVGLLVSFGSAGIVNQAMNGLAIMYARSFKCGDYVKIGDVEGTVFELTMLSTKLHTLRHEEIIIPNSVVVAQTTYNYTRIANEHGVGISTSVMISYDVPWRQVHALLKMAAENTAGLGNDPAPYVIQTALSDACVEYTLVVHMTMEPNLRQFVKSDLHQNIQDVFNRYGVQIMTALRVTSGLPDVIPEEHWYLEPAEKGNNQNQATFNQENSSTL